MTHFGYRNPLLEYFSSPISVLAFGRGLSRRNHDTWSRSWYRQGWTPPASGSDNVAEGYTGWRWRDTAAQLSGQTVKSVAWKGLKEQEKMKRRSHCGSHKKGCGPSFGSLATKGAVSVQTYIINVSFEDTGGNLEDECAKGETCWSTRTEPWKILRNFGNNGHAYKTN